MKLVLQPDEAILVQGPTRVSLESGTGHIFHKDIEVNENIIVPVGVTYPLVAITDVTVAIPHDDVIIRKVKKSEIYPQSWMQALTELQSCINASSNKTYMVMVMGGISSGKSGFISSLAHLLLKSGHQVHILDLDVGQNKLLVPGSLALSRLDSPEKHPFPRGKIHEALFLGSNSPRGLLTTIIGCCWKFRHEWDRIIKQEDDNSKKNILLIDTTGYVSGLEASALKRAKLEIFNPNHVILFPETIDPSTYEEILTTTDSLGLRTIPLSVPPSIRAQDPQDRRQTREAKYGQILKEMIPMEVTISEFTIFSYSMKIERFSDIANRLIGFADEDGWLIGLGYLKSIDIKKGTLNVIARALHDNADLKKNTKSIILSYIRLNEDGTEFTTPTTDASAKSELGRKEHGLKTTEKGLKDNNKNKK